MLYVLPEDTYRNSGVIPCPLDHSTSCARSLVPDISRFRRLWAKYWGNLESSKPSGRIIISSYRCWRNKSRPCILCFTLPPLTPQFQYWGQRFPECRWPGEIKVVLCFLSAISSNIELGGARSNLSESFGSRFWKRFLICQHRYPEKWFLNNNGVPMAS